MTDWTLIILIWTACAVVAWWIATTKKAPDPGTWAVAGLLLGPFGILGAIAFAKPSPFVDVPLHTAPGDWGDQSQAGPDMACGRCRKALSPVWRGKCQHCGARYAEVAPVVRA